MGKAVRGKTYAMVSRETNKVIWVFTIDELEEWNDDNIWVVEVPDNISNLIKSGYHYDSYLGFDVNNITQLRADIMDYVNNRYQIDLAQLEEEFIPQAEKDTYEEQYNQALLYYMTRNEENAKLIKTLAEIRQIDMLELSSKIIKKYNDYKDNISKLIGYRQYLRDKVEKSMSLDELKEIIYISPITGEEIIV